MSVYKESIVVTVSPQTGRARSRSPQQQPESLRPDLPGCRRNIHRHPRSSRLCSQSSLFGFRMWGVQEAEFGVAGLRGSGCRFLLAGEGAGSRGLGFQGLWAWVPMFMSFRVCRLWLRFGISGIAIRSHFRSR